MSSQCNFCGRKFSNSQSVRAHLRSCAVYKARRRTGPEPDIALGSVDLGSDGLGEAALGGAEEANGLSDPLRQLRERVTAERLRLELRGVEEAHDELDRRAETSREAREREGKAKTAAEAAAAKEQQAVRRRAEEIRILHEQKKTADEQRRAQRRKAIQSVKNCVVGNWRSGLSNDAELRSRVLATIEREFAKLPVAELPQGELVSIAVGLREPMFRAAQRKERIARERETRRQDLIEQGSRHAAQTLREVEDLDVFEIWRIEERIKKELERLSGSESAAFVQRVVDDVLDANGIGWDDEDEDDE